MRILHLTDFHFKSDLNARFSQDEFIAQLIKSLKNKIPIDLVLFTGDLVYSGASLQDFLEANETFINKIIESIKIEKENFIFCAGNHDIHRNKEMEAIRTHFSEKITSNSELDNFVKDEIDSQFIESCKNFTNFTEFSRQFYSNALVKYADEINRLFTIHKRTFDNIQVGIVTINSAWRSNKDNEEGVLLFPVSLIKEALLRLKGTTIKMLLMHHSLNDLMEFNSSQLEDVIFNNFHYLFSGHKHKKKQSIQITAHEGIFCCVSPATLSLNDKDARLGYTIIDTDLDFKEVLIENSIYILQDKIFLSEPIQYVQIPMDSLKREQNEFRKTLRSLYSEELIKANELFISGQDIENSKNFLELFSEPVLKTKPAIELSYVGETKYNFEYENLLLAKENYIIYGKDKSGKSSLLKKLQLDLIKEFSTLCLIPYYLDYKEIKLSNTSFKLESKIARYFHRSKLKFFDKIDTYRLILLIDNYDREAHILNLEIEHFVKKYPNCIFIATTDLTVSSTYEKAYFDGLKYNKLYIHEISRNEIRSLTNKWPNIPSERKKMAIEKIITIFNQLNIPYNYWTVSLFLWIFEKSNDLNFHNNVDLIQLYIDGLLERQKMTLDRSAKLSFENLKSFLGELAYHLMTKFYNEVYSLEYVDLVNFTEDYRKHNPRFVISTEEIVPQIIKKGILKKRDNGRYTFRLKGVFEYFLAYNMIDNEAFRNSIIEDDKFYLSFGNELELYAGFIKKDKTFLAKIFNKTKLFVDPINYKYDQLGSADINLLSKISIIFDLKNTIKQLKESDLVPLNHKEQDESMEALIPLVKNNSEVEKKRSYEVVELNAENLEKYIFILARVYRNIDLIKDEILINDIFNYIIKSFCNFGFFMLDDAQTEIGSSGKIENSLSDDKIILKIMANFTPLFTQVMIYDAAGQMNLERVIIDNIKNIKADKNKNQYILFLLYFLLIDFDVKANLKYLDELIEILTINSLINSTIIKLHYYLMFKCYEDPNLEKELRKRIQKLTKEYTGDSNFGELHKSFEETHKKNLVRR